MDFDPLNSGDYNRLESTSADGSGGKYPPAHKPTGGKRADHMNGQEILGIVVALLLILAGIILVGSIIF